MFKLPLTQSNPSSESSVQFNHLPYNANNTIVPQSSPLVQQQALSMQPKQELVSNFPSQPLIQNQLKMSSSQQNVIPQQNHQVQYPPSAYPSPVSQQSVNPAHNNMMQLQAMGPSQQVVQNVHSMQSNKFPEPYIAHRNLPTSKPSHQMNASTNQKPNPSNGYNNSIPCNEAQEEYDSLTRATKPFNAMRSNNYGMGRSSSNRSNNASVSQQYGNSNIAHYDEDRDCELKDRQMQIQILNNSKQASLEQKVLSVSSPSPVVQNQIVPSPLVHSNAVSKPIMNNNGVTLPYTLQEQHGQDASPLKATIQGADSVNHSSLLNDHKELKSQFESQLQQVKNDNETLSSRLNHLNQVVTEQDKDFVSIKQQVTESARDYVSVKEQYSELILKYQELDKKYQQVTLQHDTETRDKAVQDQLSIEALKSQLSELHEKSETEVNSVKSQLSQLHEKSQLEIEALKSQLSQCDVKSKTQVELLTLQLSESNEKSRLMIESLQSQLSECNTRSKAELDSLRYQLSECNDRHKSQIKSLKDQLQQTEQELDITRFESSTRLKKLSLQEDLLSKEMIETATLQKKLLELNNSVCNAIGANKNESYNHNEFQLLQYQIRDLLPFKQECEALKHSLMALQNNYINLLYVLKSSNSNSEPILSNTEYIKLQYNLTVNSNQDYSTPFTQQVQDQSQDQQQDKTSLK